jgi:hypothetical protein
MPCAAMAHSPSTDPGDPQIDLCPPLGCIHIQCNHVLLEKLRLQAQGSFNNNLNRISLTQISGNESYESFLLVNFIYFFKMSE